MSEVDEAWSRRVAGLVADALLNTSLLDREKIVEATKIIGDEIAVRLALNDRPATYTWLVAAELGRRLSIVEQPSRMYRFLEETEFPGDQYTGPYFTPTHSSGLYATAEDAEREARAELPWLRSGPEKPE